MNLGEVLSKAWKIIWKNKVLWIFGILASCGRGGGGGGGGGNSDFNFNNNGSGNDFFKDGNNPFSNGQFPGVDELGRSMENFFGNSGEQTWIPIFIGIFCLILILSLVFVFLGTIGRIGLIKGTLMADAGQEPLSFGQVWSASTPYFWRVFLLNLVIGLVVGVAFLVLLVPLIFLSIATMGIGVFCLIPIICLLIPVGWVINIIIEQANVAMVVEELGITDAVKRGWRVSRENLGPVAVIALIIMIGGGIVSFIISIPLVLALIPVFAGVIANDQTVLNGALYTAGAMLCCLVPVIIALSGVLQSYIGSVWTLTFLHLTEKKLDASEFTSVPPQPAI
ncbi:MAG: hypothetical protein WCG34_12925 [Leptolinea sp.]